MTVAPDLTPSTTPRRRTSTGAVMLGLKALLKGSKLLKLGLISASVAAYASLYSWEFGIVLTAAIAIHELGHVLAMRLQGIPTRGLFLIPFFGGVALGNRGTSARQEVIVAAGGPAFGLLSLLPILLLYALTGTPKWPAYAGFVAIVNLFNLLPIGILDGGRILRAILQSVDQRLSWLGTVLGLTFGVALVLVMHAYVLAIIIAFSAIELVSERRRLIPTLVPMRGGEVAIAFIAYLALGLLFGAVIEGVALVEGAGLPRLILQD